jgi:hypothetical protein
LTLQPFAASACLYSWPTMNSSVKFFVPSVSEPPEEALVLVADELDAGALDELELELELLLPHAATSSAATVASAPADSLCVNRRRSGAERRFADGCGMNVYLLIG